MKNLLLAALLCGAAWGQEMRSLPEVAVRATSEAGVWIAHNYTDKDVVAFAVDLEVARGRRTKHVHVTFDDTVATGESKYIIQAGGDTAFTFRAYKPNGDPARLAGYATDYQNPVRLTVDYVEFADGASVGANLTGTREKHQARKAAWAEVLAISAVNPERVRQLSEETLDTRGTDYRTTFLRQYARQLMSPLPKQSQGFLDWFKSLAYTATSVTCYAQPGSALIPLWNIFPFECGDIYYNGADAANAGYIGRIGLTEDTPTNYVTGYGKNKKNPIYNTMHIDASFPQNGFHCYSLQVHGGAYHSGLNVPDANNCTYPSGQTSCCSSEVRQDSIWTQVLGQDPIAGHTDWVKFCDVTIPDINSGSMMLDCGY